LYLNCVLGELIRVLAIIPVFAAVILLMVTMPKDLQFSAGIRKNYLNLNPQKKEKDVVLMM